MTVLPSASTATVELQQAPQHRLNNNTTDIITQHFNITIITQHCNMAALLSLPEEMLTAILDEVSDRPMSVTCLPATSITKN